ncbi:MAG: DHA2 family efflux MFS transporter permease subunit [Azospirillaceae bacterium]|nr:DHA2 family efflux MFS transporter permease subunit [Azospirillaceae bacterium]
MSDDGPQDTEQDLSAHADWRPRANPWAIALVVTLAAFMEILDSTIVNVSLPHIAGSLSSTYDDATWTLTSYLVANGIVLTVSGWLSSVFGRKRYFLICIIMFTVCSLLCGIAQSLPQLIVFRLLQGFFGGGLQPCQQSIILDSFPVSRRGQAFAVTAVATVVAPILGPTLGGLITDNTSWRWIFFLNIPIGLFTVIAVTALVEDPPWARRERRSIDYIGLSLITIGLGCLQVVMDRGEDDDWLASPFIAIMSVATVLGIVGAIVWLLRAQKPVVNIRVLADRNFAIGSVMIIVMGLVLYASSVLIPQFAQQVLGYDATHAGMLLSPGGILIFFLIPIVARILPHIQARLVIAFGYSVMTAGLFYTWHLVPDIDFLTLTMMRTSQTLALGFLFVPISVITYATLPKEMNADAAALFTMFRNVAGSVGISISTALVTERTQIRQAHLATWMTPLSQPYNTLVAQKERVLLTLGNAASTVHDTAVSLVYQTFRHQASVLAYTDVFAICGFATLVAIPIAFLFSPAKAGGKMPSGH